MKNMKRSKQDLKESMPVEEVYSEEYPYGLRINLGGDELKKLKQRIQNFSAGDEVRLVCKAEVVRVSATETKDQALDGDLELQITDMEMENENSESEAFAEAFKK